MGARQSKGGPGSPGSPRGRRRGLLLLLPSSSSPSSSSSSRERGGDFLASLVMRSGEKFGGGCKGVGVGGGGPGLPPPYHRRVGLIQELLGLAKEGRHEEATDLLKHLRQDLGMESTSLDDVLYRYASFRNLVDPITHDLIISLARYIHCPRPEGDSLGALEKLCRQLTYHLSPHSQWRRQGSLVKKKPQACLKTLLVENPQDHTVDLSGIPLTPKDLDRVIAYLQQSAPAIESVELCFTELTDELFLQLLPVLGALPRLSTLSLNGNRLTKAILRDLTDSLKDPRNFPSITWIDLGNNVDIFSLPQPFLVSLKKRCPTLGNLPTILEFGEGQASDLEDPPARGQEEGRHCGLGRHRPGGALEESLVPGIPGAGTEETEGSCRLPLT